MFFIITGSKTAQARQAGRQATQRNFARRRGKKLLVRAGKKITKPNLNQKPTKTTQTHTTQMLHTKEAEPTSPRASDEAPAPSQGAGRVCHER